jgi:ABC-type phosphate transport system permease subunit
MADALAVTVDLGMFSREISDEKKAKGVWWVGLTIDAVLPTISAENPFIEIIKKRGLTKAEFAAIFAGGIVLAVMCVPYVLNMLIEVFNTVPNGMKEDSLSLGATFWESVKHVVIRSSYPGIISAFGLGIAKANVNLEIPRNQITVLLVPVTK